MEVVVNEVELVVGVSDELNEFVVVCDVSMCNGRLYNFV